MDDAQELVRDVLQHRDVRAQSLCDPQLHGVHVSQHQLNLAGIAQTLRGGQVGQSDDLHDSHHKLRVLPHGHGGHALIDEYRKDDSDYMFHGHDHELDSHRVHQSLGV